MKVKIILKKPVSEHTGMSLTDAKLTVDSLHQIPYQPQEFNLSNSTSYYFLDFDFEEI